MNGLDGLPHLSRALLAAGLAAGLLGGCGRTSNLDLGALHAGPPGHRVGGTVQGLAGSGLVLRNLGADDLPIAQDGPFAFATRLASAAPFLVTVYAQPQQPAQTCTVGGGAGLVGAVDILDVAVRCTTAVPVTIGGPVAGLTSEGLVLQDLGGDDLAVPAGASRFGFATQLPTGAAYAITIKRQPSAPLQTCALQNASGIAGDPATPISLACSTNPWFAVGGAVANLAGSGLVLQDAGGDDLAVPAGSASYAFATPVQQGAPYQVTVKTQPANPQQTCVVTDGSGVVAAAPVVVPIACTTEPFWSVGGLVTGLLGSGLLLASGADLVPVLADGSFVLPTRLQAGGSFAVTVKQQPRGPVQTCFVDGGSGEVGDADVTSIAVHCVTNPFLALGGTVSGLAGSGLVLHDAAGGDLPVTDDGPFDFDIGLQAGTPYAVSVKAQPSGPLQTCAVDPATATGTMGDGAVDTVQVACATNPYFALGGLVSGLAGQGLVLHDDRAGDLPIAGNGRFTFPAGLQGTQGYSITVVAQPYGPYQVCGVAFGAGTVLDADVGGVQVTCASAPLFPIAGTVSGLKGAGLLLQDDGGDDLAVAADGPFAFPTPLQENAPYRVTVRSQPSAPFQTCLVNGGGGVVGPAGPGPIAITCHDDPAFALGGAVGGLTGAGLVLHSGGDDLPVSAPGPFRFPTALQQGQAFRVSIAAQPAGQTCAVTAGGEGVMGPAPIASVAVSCGSGPFRSVLVQVSGVAGQGLLLRHDGGDDLAVLADGTYAFADQQPDGAAFAVSVKAQPRAPLQTCAATGASGTLAGADATVAVACTTNPFFAVGGVVSGLAGSGLKLSNLGGDLLPIAGNGSFTFAGRLQGTQPFSVAVAAQPAGPLQTCAVSGGSGVIGSADVSGILVNCSTSPFFLVGGVVKGLVGAGLVLQDDLGNDVAVAADGFFIFTALLQAGQTYAVSVKTQPSAPLQTCMVANASGRISRSVTDVQVSCATSPAFTIGGAVTGLVNPGLVLQDNGTDPLAVAQDGPFTFALPVQGTLPYAVTVKTQPTGAPLQTCRVANGSGTVGAAGVGNVLVTCSVSTFAVGGTVTGLPAGASVTLQDNGFDSRAVTGSGTGSTPVAFSFGTQVASGRSWSVVQLSTAGPVSCAITGGATGQVTNAAITAITVACVPAFTVGGTLAGLGGSGLQITNATTGEVIAPAKGATTFAFGRPVSQAQGYALSVTAQPAALSQGCAIAPGSPSPASGHPAANVTDVAVSCATSAFAVGGAITGLPAGATVSLLDNGADPLLVTGTGASPLPFAFATPVASGAAFAATLAGSSGPVSCAIAGASGTVTSAAIGSIAVSCVPTFALSGTVSGVQGAGLQLKNATTGETLAIAAGQIPFAFTKPVTQAQGYAISVAAQPAGPAQSCGLGGGSTAPASGNPTADVTALSFLCAGASFAVGGKVNGLPSGATVTVLDLGTDPIKVTGAGTGSAAIAFTFPAKVADGGAWAATVSATTGPVACAVTSGGSGTVAGAAVTAVQVTCTPAFSIAGTIVGYSGSGLQLANAGTGETLTVAKGATSFAFSRLVTQAQGYALSIPAQPAGPLQTCAVSANAAGNPSANVTNAAVTCTTNAYAVGGAVTGLPAGANVTLLDNGGDATVVAGAGDGSAPIAFAFPTAVKSGAGFAATVSATSGPVSCTVAQGSGTVAGGPIAGIAVACVPAFAISGTITGYTGTGLVLRNGTNGETLAIPPGQGTFAFTKLVTQKQGYSVSASAQPTGPSQGCSVPPASPAFPAGNPTADVGNLVVACATTGFSIGGTVTGLPSGTSVVLQDNGADNRTVSGSAGGTPVAFTFPTAIPSGGAYAASVLSTAGPVVCSLTSGGSGPVTNANVTGVQIGCAPAFSVSGTITGYSGSGLQLLNTTTGEPLTVPPGQGAFAFRRLFSQAQGYGLQITAQPVNPSQVCSVAAGSPAPAAGNPAANVTGVALSCGNALFSVGGVVNGLAVGQGLTLQDSGGDDLRLSAAAAGYPFFTFATKVPSGQSYTATVRAQPPGQVCAVRGSTGVGMVGAANVTSIIVDCAPSHFLSGTASGVLGGGLVVSDGSDSVAIRANPAGPSAFAFPTALARGTAWRVSVTTPPSAPAQACTVAGGDNGDGSGTLGDADDASVTIACGAPAWRVGGTILGAANGAAGAMVLTDNGGDPLVVSTSAASTGAAVPFQFPAPVQQGQAYAVAVPTAPSGLACIVRGGAGTVGAGDVGSVQVICGYPVTGAFDTSAIAGTSGQLPSTGLWLQASAAFTPYSIAELLPIPAGAATFTFQNPAPRGGTCALAVTAQPAGPAMLCAASAAAGCAGGVVTGPIAAQVRCVEQVELIPFPGATGAALAVATDASGDVAAGGSFTGTTDLGHGARTGSGFSATGSSFAVGLDPNGARGAQAAPSSASWDRLFPAGSGGSGAARVRALVAGPSGEFYAAGSFTGAVDFGDGSGAVTAAAESIFLARLAGDGGPIWVKHFGPGAIASLAVRGTRLLAGGVYAAAAAGQESFGNAACALTAASAHRDFVAGFDPGTGDCAFAVDLAAGLDPGAAGPRPGPAVALDSAGDPIAAGTAGDATGLTRLAAPYLVTFDPTGKNACSAGAAGNELFQDATSPANDRASAVAVGQGDAILVAGHCQGTPKLKGKAVTCATGASSAFLARYASRASCAAGQLAGPLTGGAVQAVIASGGSSKGTALAADAGGNLWLAGAYSGAPAIGGAALFAGSAAESQNGFVAAFGPALATPVVQAVSSTGALSIAAVAPGALRSAWVSGWYSGTVSYRGRAPALGTTAAASEPMLLRFPQGPP